MKITELWLPLDQAPVDVWVEVRLTRPDDDEADQLTRRYGSDWHGRINERRAMTDGMKCSDGVWRGRLGYALATIDSWRFYT